jgi:hypothetical protein
VLRKKNPNKGAGEQELDEVSAGAVAVAEGPERHQRLSGTRFDHDEHGEREKSGDERQDCGGVGPAVLSGAGQPEHEQADAGGGGRCAWEVEPVIGPGG